MTSRDLLRATAEVIRDIREDEGTCHLGPAVEDAIFDLAKRIDTHLSAPAAVGVEALAGQLHEMLPLERARHVLALKSDWEEAAARRAARHAADATEAMYGADYMDGGDRDAIEEEAVTAALAGTDTKGEADDARE